MANNCIKFGKGYSSYKYILCIIIFLIIKDVTFGSEAHACFQEVKVIASINISNCFMIRKSILHLFSFILGLILYLIQSKYFKTKKFNENSGDLNDNTLVKKVTETEELNLIYTKQEIQKYPNYKLIFIIILWVIEEELISYLKNIMTHLDFWMLELIIVHFFMVKILKKEVYSHQKLMLWFCILPFLLKVTTIILSFLDPNHHLDNDKKENRFKYSDNINKFKIIYVAIGWLLAIGIILNLILITLRSYINIKIKWLIDFKYISSYKIFTIYNIVGFFFCFIVSLIASFIPCYENIKNEATYNFKDYFCIVKYDNKKYFDNLIYYFAKNEETKNNNLEGLSIVFGAFSFCLYKFFSLKIIEVLSPVYLIFSFPIYYVFNKIYLLILNYIKKGEWYLNVEFASAKLALDFSSDIVSIFGYLIYLEIIELHCYKLDFNIRRTIFQRLIMDVSEADIDDNSVKSDSKSSSEEHKSESPQDVIV